MREHYSQNYSIWPQHATNRQGGDRDSIPESAAECAPEVYPYIDEPDRGLYFQRGSITSVE